MTQKLAEQCGQVVAIDSSSKMIEVFNKNIEESGTNNILALVATVDNQVIGDHPLLSVKFDVVVASSVCSFLPNYEATLCTLATLINPNGWFVQWDWISEMPEERLMNAFEASGLAVQSVGQVFSMESKEGSAGVVMGVGRKLS